MTITFAVTMGRHTDPDILRFFADCKTLGESYGFKVIDEFSIKSGLYYVDQVWTLYEDKHQVMITFEVEKKDERTIDNIMKIVGTSTEIVEKPFQHFSIVFDEKISPGHKEIGLQQAKQFNIKLFENYKNNAGERTRLYKELSELKIDIASFIQRQGLINPLRTVSETIKGLEKITPCIVVKNQPFPISEAQVSVGLSAKTAEMKPIAFPNNPLFDTKKYKEFVIVPIPREKFIFLAPGTDFSIDTFMDITEKGGSKVITAEMCDYPFLLEVGFLNDRLRSVAFNFNPDETDFVQLEYYNKIAMLINDRKTVLLNETGKKIFELDAVNDPHKPKDASYFQTISDTALIQKIIKKRIPFPKTPALMPEDQDTVDELKSVLTSGLYETDNLQELVFGMNGKDARLYFGNQNSGIFPPQTLKLGNVSKFLFNQEIEMGELIAELPELKLKDGLNLVDKIKTCPDDEKIEIVLVPLKEKTVRTTYSKWVKISAP